MKNAVSSQKPMRKTILGTLVACAVVAMAPWMSGGQEPLAMLLSGGAVLLAGMLAWRQPEVRLLRRGPLLVSWVALMGWAALSMLWTGSRYDTAVWLVHWLMAGLVFRLAYAVAGEPKGREWLLRGYLASAAVFCVVAIGMFLTSSYERLTGTFYWANPAAAYLIPAIVLTVDKLRKNSGKVLWMWGALAVLLGSSMMLANSRAAVLVLVLVMVLYLLLAPTTRMFWIKIVFTFVITVVTSFGLVSMSNLVIHKDNAVAPGGRLTQAKETNSMWDRLKFMESGFEMWFERPVLGVGAGAYGSVHPQYQQRVVSASSNAHSAYVQMLAELGLVGAVLMAAVLLWLVTGMLRGVVASPETVPAVLGLLGLLLHFGLDVDASYPALLMLAAVLCGVVYRQWWPARGRLRLWWPIVAAGLLAPLVSLYQGDVWAVRAQVAQDDGDYELAARWYGEAQWGVVYDPDYVNAEGIMHYTMALAGGSGVQEKARLALDRARRAQQQDPYDGQHHQLAGRVLVLQGDLRGAQAEFREALRLDPYNHPEYAYDLAGVQMKSGDLDGGIGTARDMLALYPGEVVDNRNMDKTLRTRLANLAALMGNGYLAQGKVHEAKEAADQALEFDPKSVRGRALMVQIKRL